MLRRNVLIFHAAALGDFVLTWPFAVALARIFPQSRITYVTGTDKGRLAERALRLESADVEAGWHALYGGGELPERSAKLLAGAHAVYTFADVPPAWVEAVRRVNPAANVVAVGPIPVTPGQHWTDDLLVALAPHRPECEATRQLLRSVAERGLGHRPVRRGWDRRAPPAAGRPDKCWPADRFAELAQRLLAAGRRVRFVVGDVERDRWPTGDLAALSAVADVASPATLAELMAELISAELFVGNDSGPAHLAGILGVPTLALFGPTDPARYHPLGPAVRVLRRLPLTALAVNAVVAAVGAET